MHEFYIKKKMKIIKLYEKMTKIAEAILLKHYSSNMAERILIVTEAEYKEIVYRLPYIGGKGNAFTIIIEMNGWFICFYKALKNENIDVTVIVYILRAVSQQLFCVVPRKIGIQLGRLAFTSFGINYFKRQAENTLKKLYPEDFVYTYTVVKKDSQEVEVEFQFSECAVHKFYEAEGVVEMKEFCNFADPLYSERFNLGINANHTFAQGCTVCRLNFNNNRVTLTPDNIQAMINEAKVHLNQCHKKVIQLAATHHLD